MLKARPWLHYHRQRIRMAKVRKRHMRTTWSTNRFPFRKQWTFLRQRPLSTRDGQTSMSLPLPMLHEHFLWDEATLCYVRPLSRHSFQRLGENTVHLWSYLLDSSIQFCRRASSPPFSNAVLELKSPSNFAANFFLWAFFPGGCSMATFSHSIFGMFTRVVEKGIRESTCQCHHQTTNLAMSLWTLPSHGATVMRLQSRHHRNSRSADVWRSPCLLVGCSLIALPSRTRNSRVCNTRETQAKPTKRPTRNARDRTVLNRQRPLSTRNGQTCISFQTSPTRPVKQSWHVEKLILPRWRSCVITRTPKCRKIGVRVSKVQRQSEAGRYWEILCIYRVKCFSVKSKHVMPWAETRKSQW